MQHRNYSPDKPLHGQLGFVPKLVLSLAGALFGLQPPASQAQSSALEAWSEGYSRADYRLDVRLESPQMRLVGRGQLTWTNGSPDRVSEVWLHQYLNAFSNNASTHLWESDGKLRGVPISEGWGWTRLTRIAAQGAELLEGARWEAPDDGRAEDRTVLRVPLAEPVGPGERVELDVEWEAQLPRVRRRTGFKDDFLLVAQWYPKLGVYTGGRGWSCHQFHMNSEFHADYGYYDVRLDLPAEYQDKVQASGSLVESELQGDRWLARFAAPAPEDAAQRDRHGSRAHPLAMHDFAWCGDPQYSVARSTFRFEEWAARYPEALAEAQRAFGPETDLRLRQVEVLALLQPEHAAQAQRHLEATMSALFFYGLWFGEYPYEQLVAVDPAWGASGAGGMEYPGLFTCGTRLFAPADSHSPESVTVHEAGHQFWMGLVANDEPRHAWMDEGLNSYCDSEVLARTHGPARSYTRYAELPVSGVALVPRAGGTPLMDALALRRLPLDALWSALPALSPLPASGWLDAWREQPWFSLAEQSSDPREHERVSALAGPWTDPIDTCSWCFVDRAAYTGASYARTSNALRSIEGLLGRDAFLRGMRGYAQRWRFARPEPSDFFRDFEAAAQADPALGELGPLFEQLFQSTDTVDWSLAVQQRPVAGPKGLFQSEARPDGVFEPAPAADAGEPMQQIEITLRRTGEICLPLPLRLTFADGRVELREWSRAEQQQRRWLKLSFESAQKLVAAEIDPQQRYYLDLNRSNDAWFLRSDELAPLRWGERVFAQGLHQLSWFMGLGG